MIIKIQLNVTRQIVLPSMQLIVVNPDFIRESLIPVANSNA
jgi:hypothetical protein